MIRASAGAKTVGIDATDAGSERGDAEHRAAGHGRIGYEAFVRSLAEASGVETPTRADLARFDRSRKNKKTSNKEWKSPQDCGREDREDEGRSDASGPQGRARGRPGDGSHRLGDGAGCIGTAIRQRCRRRCSWRSSRWSWCSPDGPGVEEVVADKGYHSDETLVALGAVGVRSHVSEPERGRRCWQDKKTGETPPEKRAAQKALYANRRRVRGRRGRRLQRCRGEVVERSFAHLYETGGTASGVGARSRECPQARADPGGRLQQRAAPASPDRRRHAPEPAGAGSFGDLRTDRASDGPPGGV